MAINSDIEKKLNTVYESMPYQRTYLEQNYHNRKHNFLFAYKMI